MAGIRWCLPGLAMIVLSAAAGCGGRGGLSKVEGFLYLDGKPVRDATVTCLPEQGAGRPAFGKTGADGSFRLTTLEDGDGALPGTYRVIVSVLAELDTPRPEGDPSEIMGKAMAGMGKSMAKAKELADKSPIPAIYTDAEETTLELTVPTSGKVILTMSSDAPPPKRAKPERGPNPNGMGGKGPMGGMGGKGFKGGKGGMKGKEGTPNAPPPKNDEPGKTPPAKTEPKKD